MNITPTHIEHIGIAVKDLEKAILTYEQLLGTPCYKREFVEEQKVETAFFKIGESKVELLQGTTDRSVITRYVEKRGEGIHHIAYAVDDIYKAIQEYESAGFRILGKGVSIGADNKLVAFLHPKDCNGVLTELCMENPDC